MTVLPIYRDATKAYLSRNTRGAPAAANEGTKTTTLRRALIPKLSLKLAAPITLPQIDIFKPSAKVESAGTAFMLDDDRDSWANEVEKWLGAEERPFQEAVYAGMECKL